MKRRPPTRLILLLLGALVGGAIVNVAVAWGCFLRSQFVGGIETQLSPELSAATWERLSLPEWPDQHGSGQHWSCFGVRRVRVKAGLRPHTFPSGTEVFFARYMTDHKAAGWPIYAVCSTSWLDNENPSWIVSSGLRIPITVDSLPHVDLPCLPLWPGFAINTVFYAVILWGLFALPAALCRKRRLQRGLCSKCAYPIGTSEVCTECGAAVKVRELQT